MFVTIVLAENKSNQEANSGKFEIELSGNKQKHYGKQFVGAPTPGNI